MLTTIISGLCSAVQGTGVLPYQEWGGGLGPDMKFGGKVWGKVQPRSPNERKTWGVLLPQDKKVGKESQFWSHV